MTNQPDHPEQHDQDDQHIQAVLEPVAPRSQYDFVDIESEPIEWVSPMTNLSRFVASACGLMVIRVKTQWKITFVIIVLLGGSELLLRSAEPRLLHRIYSATQTGGHPIDMNAQGFRGDPVTVPKPADTYRILALGDSVTFGTGIDWQMAWPADLQSLLNDDSQTQSIEVINAALPGIDLAQIELELRERWATLEPDKIVLMITGNMVSFGYARQDREVVDPPNPRERAETVENAHPSIKDKAKAAYMSFALPGALTMGMDHLKFMTGLEDHSINPEYPTGVMLAHGYAQNGINSEAIDTAWDLFADQLASIKLATDDLGVPLMVVYSPPRFSISDQRSDNLKWVDTDRLTVDPAQRTSAICKSLDIPFVDPTPSIAQASRPAYVLSDYTHFDASGHHAIATSIYESINAR